MFRLPNWFLLFPAISGGLGTWQVFRHYEKQRVIGELAAQIEQPLAEYRGDEVEFARVSMAGRHCEASQRYALLGPRPRAGVPGFYVFTAFELAAGGGGDGGQPPPPRRVMAVNRGWVSREAWEAGEVELGGDARTQGLLRKSEKANFFLKTMRGSGEMLHWRDNDEINAILGGTEPMTLDERPEGAASAPPPAAPIPRDYDVESLVFNRHLEYIFTWYGLSLALSLIWVLSRRKGGGALGKQRRK